MMTIIVLLPLASASPGMSAEGAVAAVVNGKPISMRDLEEAVDRILPRATFHGSLSEERRAEYREKALEDVITFELQYQDALTRGLEPDSKQVKEMLKQVRDAFPSSGDYKKWLKGASLTERQLKEKIEKQALVQAVTNAVVIEPSHVSDAALREYYDRNIHMFKYPESVKLRIISTKDEAKANGILARLDSGEDFGSVAARMSEDAYRIKGGDIGFVHRGRIYPALEEAAFKLKPGQVSELIRTEGLWFIIKVEDRVSERMIPFDEAKDGLKKDLEKKRRDELMEKWIEPLRAKASIEIRLPEPQSVSQ
jgi:peptidyl-prolyl cis-trans isomerase C